VPAFVISEASGVEPPTAPPKLTMPEVVICRLRVAPTSALSAPAKLIAPVLV